MRKALLCRFVVTVPELMRNWWQNRYKGRKTLSSNSIQQSQESNSRELFFRTSSSFAPAFTRARTTATGRMFHKLSNKRGFGRFTNGTCKTDSELNICFDGRKPYKRSRTLCCGLSSERLDVEEGNSTRISNLDENLEADEAHVKPGNPSKVCYQTFCNLIKLNRFFFPRKEQKRILLQSKVGETPACFRDSILLNPVDAEHLEPLQQPVASEPCPERNHHSNAGKHLKMLPPKETLQETVSDNGGHQTNQIHAPQDSSDISAADEQNCSEVESNLQMRSKELIKTMITMPRLPEESFVKAERLKHKSFSVAKLEVAQEGCQQSNDLHVSTKTDNLESSMEIETIRGQAKLPNFISETKNGVSVACSHCDVDTSTSSIKQNYCMFQAFLQTEKTSYEYPAICNRKNSCQILAGNEGTIINPLLLSSTKPLSITKVFDGVSLTKKLLNFSNKKKEFWTTKKQYVNNRVHLYRKRRSPTPFQPKSTQLQFLRRKKKLKAEGGYRMQSDMPYTENPCEVNVNKQDKKLLLSSHGKKRKLEALFETFSSSSLTIQSATNAQIKNKKRSDVMPDMEHMLFRFGIEAGYMLMLPSTTTKIHQLNQSLENSKKLVAKLRNKHDLDWCSMPKMLIVQQQIDETPCVPGTARKCQSSSRASDLESAKSCRHLDDYEVREKDSSSDVSVLTIDRTTHNTVLEELEKELEAELELMELNIVGGNLSTSQRRLSNLEADGTAAVLHQIESPDSISESPGSSKSNHDVDSKSNTCKHDVSSTLPDQEFLPCTAEERQRARILDLEVQVSMAKRLINSREREILWWKDCALHLTKHQALPNTENAPEQVPAAVEENKKQPADTNFSSLETSPDAIFLSDRDFLSVDFNENTCRDGMDYRLTTWLYTPDSMKTVQGAIDLAHSDNWEDLGSVEKDLCLDESDRDNPATSVLKGCDVTCKIEDSTSCHQKKLAIEKDISIMWDEDYESDHSCVSFC